MNIYISGISGTGMGPLALMAKNAGLGVTGSDKARGAVSEELEKNGIVLQIGEQTGEFLQEQVNNGGVDWFVYTSALPEDHPELLLAKKLGIKISKRDELIEFLTEKLNLKMIAVSGTHGKTTTTAMIIWACVKLGIPISYLVGTTLPFAGAGQYDPKAKYLIYEADEYDRNFLHFHPYIAVITTVTYDHPDIYPSEGDYKQAFSQFEQQSEQVVQGGEIDNRITLAGEARRFDATLALNVIKKISDLSEDEIIAALNKFPGVGRRFERLMPGVYSDYGHHPEEITATIEMAKEEAKNLGLKGVVAIYEPHQNTRQYKIVNNYHDAFNGVDKLYWLPTFLTREDPSLDIITPEQFVTKLDNSEIAEAAEMNNELAEKLKDYQKQGYLILLMTAGPADLWFRNVFGSDTK